MRRDCAEQVCDRRSLNSLVMHPSMPDDYKQMVFKKSMGVFSTSPTKVIRALKLRPIRDRAPTDSVTLPAGGIRTVEMPTEPPRPQVSKIGIEMSQRCDHFGPQHGEVGRGSQRADQRLAATGQNARD